MCNDLKAVFCACTFFVHEEGTTVKKLLENDLKKILSDSSICKYFLVS